MVVMSLHLKAYLPYIMLSIEKAQVQIFWICCLIAYDINLEIQKCIRLIGDKPKLKLKSIWLVIGDCFAKSCAYQFWQSELFFKNKLKKQLLIFITWLDSSTPHCWNCSILSIYFFQYGKDDSRNSVSYLG